MRRGVKNLSFSGYAGDTYPLWGELESVDRWLGAVTCPQLRDSSVRLHVPSCRGEASPAGQARGTPRCYSAAQFSTREVFGVTIRSFCELRLRLGRVGALLVLLVLPALAAPSGLLAGTLIFSDGFESGDLSQWPLAGVPVVITSAGTTQAIEGAGPQPVDDALTVSDTDSANLAGASVTILDPADGLSEVLDGPDCAGLVVTPGPSSLAISGSQPLAIYETCLRSVTWDDTAATPTPGTPPIAFTVDEGTSTIPKATISCSRQRC